MRRRVAGRVGWPAVGWMATGWTAVRRTAGGWTAVGWLVLGSLGCCALGCGGGGAGPAAPSPEVADSKHLTDFQRARLLGHYSTEDGKSGFILDRTGAAPRARLDGDGAVETLAEQGSVSGAVELVSPSKKIWLRVNKESGDVLLFQGPKQHEGVRVVRDADAQPLK